MAVVRIPESAKALLPYCEPFRGKRDDCFFPSYAHLVIFAASIGFKRDEYDEDVSFISKEPYPIQLDIFQSQGLYDFILILGLSKEKAYEIIQNEELLATTIEGYASAGFREMLRVYERCSGHNYIDEWVQEILSSE
jgi:dnd system-associated protein 4